MVQEDGSMIDITRMFNADGTVKSVIEGTTGNQATVNALGQLSTTPYDPDGRPYSVDKSTWATTTIEYEHHEIHGGSHYYICDSVSLGNAASIDLTVQTPNTSKWAHMLFAAEGTGKIQLQIFEGSDYDADGVLTAPLNNNRNSDNSSSVILRANPTVNTDGSQIFNAVVGANKIAGSVTRSKEIILKQNTKYIFRITNGLTTANIVSWCGEWYEHTDKEVTPHVESSSSSSSESSSSSSSSST